MDREGGFTGKEIVGIAVAGAIAIGGIVTALARSHDRGSRDGGLAAVFDELGDAVSGHADGGRVAARTVAERLASTYPDVRRELAGVVERAAGEIESRRDQVESIVSERTPDSLIASLADRVGTLRDRAEGILDELVPSSQSMTSQVVELVSGTEETTSTRIRETFVSIAALSAVGAVVYLVLMSPTRREALKDALCRVLEMSQVFSDDFRGYDDGY